MRIAVDTDVLLDLLVLRSGHVEAALRAVHAAQSQGAQLVTTACVLQNAYFVGQRHYSEYWSQERWLDLLDSVELIGVPKAALERAVDYVDYEDAVLALSMQYAAVRMLWTRNGKDFKEFASIAALSPEVYLAGLSS
jgi:predicted nucleic acid-binding protein